MKKIIYILTTICFYYAALLQAQTSQNIQLRVESSPKEAQITVDGNNCGFTPSTLTNLVPGTHIVTISKKDYEPYKESVLLNPGERLLINKELTPITGLLLIHSKPEGADVEVDGVFKGKTPLLVTDLKIGKYTANFSLKSYKDKKVDIYIIDRRPQKLDVELESCTATINFESSPAGADVIINGINRGSTPLTVNDLSIGQANIQIKYEGCKTFETVLNVQAGDVKNINVDLPPLPGNLKIVSIPPKARIYVNDQFKGESPVTLTGLEPKLYKVRAELPGYEIMQRNIVIMKADNKTEEFRLKKNCGSVEVVTQPSGVTVYIDGKEAGKTIPGTNGTDRISAPLRIDFISLGKHKVRLSKVGYGDVDVPVFINKDQVSPIKAELDKIFIIDYRVKTVNKSYTGMLLSIEPNGDIRLETSPGIIKRINKNDIIQHSYIRN